MAALFISGGMPESMVGGGGDELHMGEAMEALVMPPDVPPAPQPVHIALSEVVPPQAAEPAASLAASSAAGDGTKRVSARSVLLMAPDDDGSTYAGGRSVVSQLFANPAGSVLNPNPTNHARSVVLDLDHGSTIDSQDRNLQSRLQAVRASLQDTKAVNALRRSAEDSSLGNIQTHVWDALVQLSLDAVCSRTGVSRTALGWEKMLTGGAHMEKLRQTMKHLAGFCARHSSGEGASAVPLAGGLAAIPVAADLQKHIDAFGVALNQDVGLRRRRIHQHLSNCERAFADFVHVAKGASARACFQHAKLSAATDAMKARINAEEATKRKEFQVEGGRAPAEALAALETASIVSKQPNPDAPRRISSASLSHELRRRSDRLHTTIQVLLRQQLQAVKDKGRLLANISVAPEGGLQGTLMTVKGMEEKIAALGEQASRLNTEREELEAAWRLSDQKTLTLAGGSAAVSSAAERTVRKLAQAQAQVRAQRLATVETVVQALRNKLAAETRAAEGAIFRELGQTLMESRTRLAQRVEAARQLEDAHIVKTRGELKKLVVELGRNVSIRGGVHVQTKMQTAADHMVAHHMTARVKEHLASIDAAVRATPNFVRHLR